MILKTFLRIAWKKKSIWGAYTLVFFIFSILFSQAYKVNEKQFQVTSLSLAVIDHDQSDLSRALKDHLLVTNKQVEIADDPAVWSQALFEHQVETIVVIESNFAEKMMRGEKAVSLKQDPRYASTWQIRAQVNNFMGFAAALQSEDGQADLSPARLQELKRILAVETPIMIADGNSGSPDNEKGLRYYHFIAYVMLATVIGVLGSVLSDFHSGGVQARMMSSSYSTTRSTLEMVTGQLIVVSLMLAVYLIGGPWFMPLKMTAKWYILQAVNAFLFSMTCVTMTYFLTRLITNVGALMAFSTGLSLGLSFISGVMVPQSILSANVLQFAKLFPVYHYVYLTEHLTEPFSQIWQYFAVQLLFAVIFLLLAMLVQRIRRQRDSLNLSRATVRG